MKAQVRVLGGEKRSKSSWFDGRLRYDSFMGCLLFEEHTRVRAEVIK